MKVPPYSGVDSCARVADAAPPLGLLDALAIGLVSVSAKTITESSRRCRFTVPPPSVGLPRSTERFDQWSTPLCCQSRHRQPRDWCHRWTGQGNPMGAGAPLSVTRTNMPGWYYGLAITVKVSDHGIANLPSATDSRNGCPLRGRMARSVVAVVAQPQRRRATAEPAAPFVIVQPKFGSYASLWRPAARTSMPATACSIDVNSAGVWLRPSRL